MDSARIRDYENHKKPKFNSKHREGVGCLVESIVVEKREHEIVRQCTSCGRIWSSKKSP